MTMVDALRSPTMIDHTADLRTRMSRAKKNSSLKRSILFNKVKHSDEWHRNVEATAGRLRPSDPSFPWGFIRNHTDVYIRRKGNISPVDSDTRLAILVETHTPKDIAVASAAHAMTAPSLRQLLDAELNVAHGSYQGLGTWLQCLIAANAGNPAAVSDLEAQWARVLLPYAADGISTACSYLTGIGRAMRKTNISDIRLVPGFLVLLQRAITHYATQLEGFRLGCQWIAAKTSVSWLRELDRSTHLNPSSAIRIEHFLDAQFAVWRVWASWEPNLDHITRLSNIGSARSSTILDLISLEGPDVITGRAKTLRQALVAQYTEEQQWVNYRNLVIEVPNRTRGDLASVLERIVKALEKLSLSYPGSESLHGLLQDLTFAEPITEDVLNVLEGTLEIQYTPENDCYSSVREIWTARKHITGLNYSALQKLLEILTAAGTPKLREAFCRDWLIQGVEKCFHDCQALVRIQLHQRDWIDPLLELHAFGTTVKRCKHIFQQLCKHFQAYLGVWPAPERMASIVEIYTASQSVRRNRIELGKSNLSSGSDLPLKTVRKSSMPHQEEFQHPLDRAIKEFSLNHLLGSRIVGTTVPTVLDDVVGVWESTRDSPEDGDRRMLALMLSRDVRYPSTSRCNCIAELAMESRHVHSLGFVRALTLIVRDAENDLRKAVVALARLLTTRESCTRCWGKHLYIWLQESDKPEAGYSNTFIEYSLQTLGFRAWLSFVESLKALDMDALDSDIGERTVPRILQPQLSAWVTEMTGFTNTLVRLEDTLANPAVVYRILNCDQRSQKERIRRILIHLQRAEGSQAEEIMQRVVGWDQGKRLEFSEVEDCLINLVNVDSKTLQACNEIWDARHGFMDLPGIPAHERSSLCSVVSRQDVFSDGSSQRYAVYPNSGPSNPKAVQWHSVQNIAYRRYDIPLAVAEVIVAGWIQDHDVDPSTKVAIDCIARFLGLEVYRDLMPEIQLTKATEFWRSVEQEILVEAARLERLKRLLRANDPLGTVSLLRRHNIPDTSPLEEEVARLPMMIAHSVELISDEEIEMTFTLGSYTELRRDAMGVPKAANNLIIRIALDQCGDAAPKFCVHFDCDADLDSLSHFPWTCCVASTEPNEQICTSPQTAFTWQLNRRVYADLRHSRDVAIAELYKRVQKTMGEMGSTCVSCGASHDSENTQLRRSTPCGIVACAQLWYKLPLDIRIPEIRTDISAVDVLLCSVYSAACTGNSELLPSCPIRDHESIKSILNSLPSLDVIRDAVNISTVLQAYHKDAERLISWACLHHRGYIATAKGLCKIKNLPFGTHQFVFANASPGMESAFNLRVPAQPPTTTTVLFHGTSVERLPSILNKGLIVCSGTQLQRTGAIHGRGIYLAEDPATSFSYSCASLGWRNSTLSNMRLILGCEVAEAGRSVASGIHLITDERSVMVRYIFLFRNNAIMPVASHIVTAMASAMTALRNGVV